MTTFYFMSGWARVATVLIAACGLLPAAWAQGSADDVHVTPRVQHAQAQNDHPVEDPALNTRMIPIKVDVNLVLMSV
jgi:hypothetical protein